MKQTADALAAPASPEPQRDHLRYQRRHAHLSPTFWITANVLGWSHFDAYPFILLNLAFSLQAAYAAPLILLAQTRQAARDKALAEADAEHREALAHASEERQALAEENAARLIELLNQNTELTELTRQLAERIEKLTAEVHGRVVPRP